jgi:oxygen-independent coproporphyrinogen-3 oxidase
MCSYKDRDVALDTIFFGGGTPSLLSPEELCRITNCIKESFRILPGAEFTVEANPKTLEREKLECFIACGVNRLSIGLQSIHENELKKLGRIHSFEDFLTSYNLARECGIENINIDLMYGIPEQTKDSFGRTLDVVSALKPEHISLYGLILEEGTPLYESRETASLPTEDSECDMYYLATERLRSLGYSHYEISNYALSGRECRHNLKYWRCDEFIGVGLSAYSHFDGMRYGNGRDVDEYLLSNGEKYDCESIGKQAAAYEYVMLGLRLAEGISLWDYKERFGSDFLLGREALVNRLISSGYLSLEDGRLALTESGFYVSNSIINELI